MTATTQLNGSNHERKTGGEPRAYPTDSHDALILLDAQRHVLWMNEAAEELTGRKSDEVAGKRYCHELFQCRGERGQRLFGPECPGAQGFVQHRTRQEAEYTITRSDGEQVRVVSDYRFVTKPHSREGLAMLRMRRANQHTERSRNGFSVAAVLGFVALGALLLVLTTMAAGTSYDWMNLGKLDLATADTPTAMTFTYPASATTKNPRRGAAYVSALRGQPLTAIESACPYDGAQVYWHEDWEVFVCPGDGSVFQASGEFVSGAAAHHGLRRLEAKWDGLTVTVRVPRAPAVTLKDMPETPPMFYGP